PRWCRWFSTGTGLRWTWVGRSGPTPTHLRAASLQRDEVCASRSVTGHREHRKRTMSSTGPTVEQPS
ncbi:hypothetical protein ACWDKQ_35960, partial [Saccharopolyspora sp. NPDC000995]